MYSASHSLIRRSPVLIIKRNLWQSAVSLEKHVERIEPNFARYTPDAGVKYGGPSLVDRNLYTSRSHLTEWITNNVIHEDDRIVALMKLSGTPVFGSSGEDDGSDQPDTPVTIRSILPHLRDIFRCQELNIALGIPSDQQCQILILEPVPIRYHSGVVLLSKTQETKTKIEKCVQTAQTQKLPHLKYVAVTCGIPMNIEEGVEEMGFTRKKFGQKVLTVRVEKSSKTARQAGEEIVTVFKTKPLVLNTKLSAALVQIQANKAKWDSIETFMTEKLCSILGDQLYSGRVSKVLGIPVHVEPSIAQSVTQNLSRQFLRKLKVHEDDLPQLPLHLHRQQVELPNFPTRQSGKLVITAPLPDYFQATVEKLDLSPHPSWTI